MIFRSLFYSGIILQYSTMCNWCCWKSFVKQTKTRPIKVQYLFTSQPGINYTWNVSTVREFDLRTIFKREFFFCFVFHVEVFWVVTTPWSEDTNVSENPAAYIFRVLNFQMVCQMSWYCYFDAQSDCMAYPYTQHHSSLHETYTHLW
jgi:hypothetical protein